MALTDIEIKDKIYLLLRAKGLHSEITGRIYKDNRPDNSTLEDVEINILAGDARQNQEVALNVNVYVYDVKREDEMIENIPRLRTLCRTFETALESNVYDGFKIVLASQRVMKISDRPIHVIVNRLTLNHIQEADE